MSWLRRWIPAQRPWHGASCTQPCSARAHWTASRWRSPLRISRQSKVRLEQASLTTTGNASGAVSADLTEVDALSGATITSSAVTTIVNNSYFYVTGVLCAE